MWMPKLKLWMLLIAVAVLSSPLAFLVSCIVDDAKEEEFFGADGVLQRGPRIWTQLSAGRDALRRHRPAEAEARFRSALEEIGRNIGSIPVDMSVCFGQERFNAWGGLADALAAQGRPAEALPLYGEALASLRDIPKSLASEVDISDDPRVAELLKNRAACLKALDRGADSKR